jgi:hypothetical protein
MSEEMPKRIEMIFQDATENLRFLKQQQWIITRYALTAYAALFAVMLALDNERSHALILVAVWLVAVFSIAILFNFILALKKFRGRIAWIYRNAFHKAERDELELGKQKDLFNRIVFVCGLMGVCLARAAIATLAILCPR